MSGCQFSGYLKSRLNTAPSSFFFPSRKQENKLKDREGSILQRKVRLVPLLLISLPPHRNFSFSWLHPSETKRSCHKAALQDPSSLSPCAGKVPRIPRPGQRQPKSPEHSRAAVVPLHTALAAAAQAQSKNLHHAVHHLHRHASRNRGEKKLKKN